MIPKRSSQHRKLRRFYNEPGHAHEFTFSCYRRLPMLDQDRTRQWLVDSIKLARTQHAIAILAYVIMPEHAHLLLMPRNPVYRMESIAKSIKQSVARKAIGFLRKHDSDWMERNLRGEVAAGRTRYYFWQPGGGYDRNLDRPKTLGNSCDYLHNNPVRRGLVTSPMEWVWSSARWYAGYSDVPLAMDRVAL